MSTPIAQQLAEAADKRHANAYANVTTTQRMQDHERQQHFRRLIDPGIFRPNSRQVAMDSLKTLSTIAENILREPDNPKYQSFKHENGIIKRRLVEPRGALEYALAPNGQSSIVAYRGDEGRATLTRSFVPKVSQLESSYVFNPRKMEDLLVGAKILSEALERETERDARESRNVVDQRVINADIARTVRMQFLDDRAHQRERESRRVQVSQGTTQPRSPSPVQSDNPVPMPGLGHRLVAAQPPSYDD